jgi:predicted methyltransferase
MTVSLRLTRRILVASAAGLALVGCRRREPAAQEATQGPAPAVKAAASTSQLEAAVGGAWRVEDAKRDAWRHPLQTLQFFGLAPGMTVVEMWPGSGWYTQILAPFLKETGGKLYAASFETPEGTPSAAAEVVSTYRALLDGKRGLYGNVAFGSFGPTSGPLAPAGTVDLVLFMQTLHNWMSAGLAEKAFVDAFAALKPGGVLGVEAHRAETGRPQDPLAANGYIQEGYVKQLAEEAGFRFDAASEINANPADKRDHPFGVWTLPPERRSSAPGEAPDPAFDRAAFDAIGESDRMTLRFIKPR